MFSYHNYKSSVCQSICRDVDCYKRCINIDTHFVPYKHFNYNYLPVFNDTYYLHTYYPRHRSRHRYHRRHKRH